MQFSKFGKFHVALIIVLKNNNGLLGVNYVTTTLYNRQKWSQFLYVHLYLISHPTILIFNIIGNTK